MNRLKKLKKIRLHREGTSILIVSASLLIGINALLFWGIECKIPFYIFAAASIVVYLLMVNFFRLMISIFMSIVNVHANWYPVDGVVKHVDHHNGKFMKAWLPKASTENERSMVVIETPEGHTVMARQIAGAIARRIVTYAEVGEDCYIDEHMGFIKFGSRVDVYLPLGTEVCVKMGQATVGNETVIAKLK